MKKPKCWYKEWKKVRPKRTEEEKTERSIRFVKYVIKDRPETCLELFDDYYKNNKRGFDALGIFNKDDLRNYINGIED